MKKHGFTLVELLAVIIILAILATLVITVMNSTVNTSAEKLYKNQVENIIEASRSYVLKYGFNNEITICELKKVGLLDKKIKNPKTENLFDDALLVVVSKDSNGDFKFEFDGVTKKLNYSCEY